MKPSSADNVGEVIPSVSKILRIDVNVVHAIPMANDITEIHLYVNGRKLSTIHPERARRMGLVDRDYLD